MIQFKPYPSFGSPAEAAWMESVREAVPRDALWSVQEKVLGVQVSFLCDDLDVRMARRTAILDLLEPFYGYQKVLDRYGGHIYHIFNLVRLACPSMTSIAVYGELFGGVYPHPDVPPRPRTKPVQKGIWYSPGVDFYAFDLYVFTREGGFFLPVREADYLFSTAGLLYARTLFAGTLDDCLDYPCVFPATLPSELGLPPIKENYCEGIVLKPLVPVILPDGTRVAVKKINPAL